MNKLEDVDMDRLRDALAEASSAKAAKRLMIALAYADDIRVETLSERYDIPRATVYSWLDRFEKQSISEAIEDESRPGRPSKLGASQREQLLDDLKDSPTELGYNASKWTPERVQRHIERTYDVTYSLGHVRRLLRELPINRYVTQLIQAKNLSLIIYLLIPSLSLFNLVFFKHLLRFMS